MKTIYYTATSLDGFIADADNSLDWLLQFGDGGGDYEQFIAGVGAVAMGATTYLWLLEHGQADPWPYAQPTWVFTTRDLPRVGGVRFVQGDVAPVHAEMAAAAGGKNIFLVGGGELVGKFADQALLDELIVHVAPVTLGGGAPLLPRRIAFPPLRLLSATASPGGLARLHYAR